VVVDFKLLVEDSNSVPKLWILDVFKGIEGSLVSIE